MYDFDASAPCTALSSKILLLLKIIFEKFIYLLQSQNKLSLSVGILTVCYICNTNNSLIFSSICLESNIRNYLMINELCMYQ